ncbi:disulfide bond formation protein B [Candidatus Kaiserbacteria bacterium]|nr:disulfide bond formation protein B [Candidatus Kaiserbacteria bacterium]
MPPLEAYSYWVALGAVFLQVATAYLLIEYFFLTERYSSPYLRRFGLWLVAATGAVSAILSLVYSEVYGFIPCGLCWVERGLLYSLTILSVTALWRYHKGARDTAIADYGLVLAVIGALVSFYHHYGQMTGGGLICPSSGLGADCARRLVFEFGYITLPLMSFSAFVFFIAVFLHYRRG